MAVKVSKGMSPFATEIYKSKYAWKDEEGNPTETWEETAHRVVSHVLGALNIEQGDEEFIRVLNLIKEKKFVPGGRYLYAAGRQLHQVNNCFLVRAEDSREGWADLLKKAAMVLQTGGGLGVEYSEIRPEGSPIRKTGGVATGPLALMQMVNEIGRGVMQGGTRRSALIALLDWDHGDVFKYIHIKDWREEVKTIKEDDFNFPAHMDMTNISINLNDEFFEAHADSNHPKHDLAVEVYDKATRNMIKTGEPGFSINVGKDSEDKLRNPCGEVVSADDSDCCNLGSINLSRIDDVGELVDAIKYSTLFLLAGTVYSDLPYEEVSDVRDKNRRIGLGLMGVHEWLLNHDYGYEPNDELGELLHAYDVVTEDWSEKWSSAYGLNKPIASKSIAPTGTIGIISETTTGIEPIFCVAYKRRFLSEGTTWKYQYVVDPTAKRLIEDHGIAPEDIEDAYTLSYNVEKRVAFQAWIQKFVDQGVSSTINLPAPITDEEEVQDFKQMLIGYLPNLRGITAYPDGARGGQPLVPSTYEEAIDKVGVIFEEDLEASCRNGVCGA